MDFFRRGESLLGAVCLLVASLTMEYLTLLSGGFVALLVGGEAFDGESANGEVLREEGRLGGDRDVGRDAGCSPVVPGMLCGAVGGGVEGGVSRP